MKLEPVLMGKLRVGDKVWTYDGFAFGEITRRHEIGPDKVHLEVKVFNNNSTWVSVGFYSSALTIGNLLMHTPASAAINLPPNVQINTSMMQTSAPPPTEDLPLTWEELKEGMQVRTAGGVLLTVAQVGLVFFKIHIRFDKADGGTILSDGDPLDLASVGNEFLYRVRAEPKTETSVTYDPMDEYQTKYSTEW